MQEMTPTKLGRAEPLAGSGSASGRRAFLKRSGLLAATVALAACDDEAGRRTITEVLPAPPPDTLPDPGQNLVNLGSGDVGILNYAYALEQLEATFYIMVVERFTAEFTAEDRRVLTDLRNHEVAHREFLAAALGDNAIPDLQFDFSMVDFSSRQSVLQTAMAFEDLGVTAYNGAGPLLTNKDFLRAAGKIASVEARHASAIRDLLRPGEDDRFFAGDGFVNPKLGLAPARSPGEVLKIADPFIVPNFATNGLPSANIIPAEQWITL